MLSAEEKFEAMIDEAIHIGAHELGLHSSVMAEVLERKLKQEQDATAAREWCEVAARKEAAAGDPEIGAQGSVQAEIFIYPHERSEALDQYCDWLTPEQVDEIEEAPETALVKLSVNLGAGTSTVLIIPEE